MNTSSTRVEVAWAPGRSRVLSEEEKARVAEKLASRLDTEGVLRVVASDTRSQLQNRELAEARMGELVRQALVVPRKRRATKPTRASKQARLDQKKAESRKKANRRRKDWD